MRLSHLLHEGSVGEGVVEGDVVLQYGRIHQPFNLSCKLYVKFLTPHHMQIPLCFGDGCQRSEQCMQPFARNEIADEEDL